ncbi:MAG: ABC-2 family transporter protein [Ardenticatenaceae bacterium]|nr:ABC-2 family transporter protein [Anaerolineales bacterium]MCB8919944.1 ABC-2 family transporter protein [Ardenticatenaceae bacterium]MCB8989791.1 ABC-2 family transporter protein [Ardenticatenaceae bacterium]MCB9003967.1 ABC-2 family transporter protein [Ardenticatenaceae bacterium]
MRHTLTLYRRLLGVQIRSQLQYRVAFFMDLLATGLTVCLEFASLALVLQRFQHIRGWTMGEVAFLYGMVEIAFGIMDLVFSGFDPGRFGQEVRRGTFDQILLRPVNITVQVLTLDFALRRLAKITVGIGIFIVGLQGTMITWTPAKLLYLPFVLGSMVCFFGGLFVVGATITFWTVESIEVMNILTYGGSFTISYPMSIYPDWLRRFFTYIVPAIFLNYYPALYILDKPDPFNFPPIAPFLAPLVGLITLALSLAFWRFGITHYQSTGT